MSVPSPAVAIVICGRDSHPLPQLRDDHHESTRSGQ
jgi:hypothetical protein